ncbi:lytic transglycosylase domain-containing protein [Nocardioides sp. KR10-350]|uniref:lytic transglycosylase domain-containing protein n=1 Tax=Nocardioides cheoyonin TaxID=3156615 RepID=UPI0032B3C0B3
MSAPRFGRLHKATALVPLAVLSAAWTVNVTGLTSTTSAVASNTTPPAASLPDGTALPSGPISAPASVSAPEGSNRGLSAKKASDIVATASSSGIPSAALAAYQRAATIIDDADKSCHLDWQLIAAIGRVESNHGRADGNRLTSNGLSTPGIFGPALNGRTVSLIRDTDGGRYDGDTSYDRAVGPMQFIPSTWSMVGVDADGDGKRNPQDINDAALATAVYLCSGDDDLSTLSGQRAAVFRYNHSQSYVSTVLGVASAYRAGDYTSVPDNTVTTDWTFTPSAPPAKGHGAKHGGKAAGGHTSTGTPAAGTGSTPSTGGSSSSSGGTSSTGGSGSGGSSNNGAGSKGSDKGSGPTDGNSSAPDPVGAAGDAVQAGGQAVEDTITKAEATTKCVGQVIPAQLQDVLSNAGVLGGTLSQIVGVLNSPVAALLGGKEKAATLQDCVNKLVGGS